MRFRPCIDIHDGKVKQIVGGSLSDSSGAKENFVASRNSDYYASLYKQNSLSGGHIILLNKAGTDSYNATRDQALLALSAYPGGMQIGGGITAENAKEYIDAGASHVIVTSYVFTDGKLDYAKLNALKDAVGKEHLVLDMSCRQKDGKYYVVVDRWQTFTDVEVTADTLEKLADYCDEFLIHGVDVEGMQQGIDEKLIKILAEVKNSIFTYAGGVRGLGDIDIIEKLGEGRIDFTIGSALDIFGGNLSFEEVCHRLK